MDQLWEQGFSNQVISPAIPPSARIPQVHVRPNIPGGTGGHPPYSAVPIAPVALIGGKLEDSKSSTKADCMPIPAAVHGRSPAAHGARSNVAAGPPPGNGHAPLPSKHSLPHPGKDAGVDQHHHFYHRTAGPSLPQGASMPPANNPPQPSPFFTGMPYDGGGKPVIREPTANGKRAKTSPEQGAVAHHDALMELARENLLLKHQLHVASLEVNRLKDVVDTFKQLKDDKKDSKQSQSRYWSEEEHQRFLVAIQTYGHKDVKSIANVVATRSATQVRTHAQKYFMKLARSRKTEAKGKGSNPDQDPSEAAEDNEQDIKSMEAAAAAAAAAGEAGTSAAAAAAFVAATNSKQVSGSKQRPVNFKAVANSGEPSVSIDLKGSKAAPVVRTNHRKGPGSPGSMGSSGSIGCSDSTSNGNNSNGIRSSDTTVGHGSTGSSNSNGHRHGNGNKSSSDSGRCGDSNNGVSSTEGSDHGFFDTGAEEEDNFPDELPDDNGGTYLQNDAEDIAQQALQL